MKSLPNARFMAISLLAASTAAIAGPIYQVKDINPGSDNGTNFLPMAENDGRLVFWGYDGVSGTAGQPWISDGTDAGTAQIAPIINSGGSFSSLVGWSSSGGKAYFVANDGFSGPQLWTTDGTVAGTLNPTQISNGSTVIRAIHKKPGGVYFVADSTSHLWTSDGTAAGTVVALADYQTNFLNTQVSVDYRIFFYGRQSSAIGQNSLILTDGTDAGTTTYGGVFGIPTDDYIAVNDTIYFTASTSAEGNELWHATTPDDAAQGAPPPAATLVKDIVSGTGSSNAQPVARVDDKLFFVANSPGIGHELWVTDGTAANTVLVKDIAPGVADSSIVALAAINGVLYFGANDGTHGLELWRSDGTSAGTSLVKDIAPGSESGMIAYAPGITASHELFFVADDGSGSTLWMSDGTGAGTRMVDASAPFVDANTRMAAANGRLFFEASSSTAGRELYAVDLLQLLGLKWYKNAEQPLQDMGTVSSRFSLPAGVPITSLSVSVDSGHTWMGDLIITLQHVDSGKSVILLNRPGYNGVSGAGCSGKLLNVTFVDSAGAAADATCTDDARPAYPLRSSYRPTAPLREFNGDNSGGDWVLTVEDAAAGDSGMLHEWGLIFNDTIFSNEFEP